MPKEIDQDFPAMGHGIGYAATDASVDIRTHRIDTSPAP
jgi:hypothetical protein